MRQASLIIVLISGLWASGSSCMASRLYESGPISQKDSIQYTIIRNHDKTFGYDISINGTPIIHQAIIPGEKGTSGFSNYGDAKKVAELVVLKLKKGIRPPTISREEMRKAGLAFE